MSTTPFSRLPARVRNKLTVIARKECQVPTLETQHSDSLDFHDISVACLRDGLAAAYQAGRRSVAARPPIRK